MSDGGHDRNQVGSVIARILPGLKTPAYQPCPFKAARFSAACPARWEDCGGADGRLFSEDLHHGFILGLIHLRQRLFDQGAVFKSAVVEHLSEAEGGVPQQDL